MRRALAEGSTIDRVGLAVGLTALLAAALVPAALAQVVGLALATSLAMVWGLVSLLRVAHPTGDAARADEVFVALVPFLAAGVLARLLAGDPGSSMTVALRETALPEVLALLVGILVYLAADRLVGRERPDLHAGLAGWTLALGLLALHLQRARPITGGEALTLATTAVLVGLALALQAVLARRLPWPRARPFAGGAALAVAGAQLLDGVVSTLAVRDPFDWLERGHTESVALSAVLIDLAGPAYPLVKWAIALVVVGVLEHSERTGDGEGHWTNRFALFVFVTFLGLGPGLFSATRVLG